MSNIDPKDWDPPAHLGLSERKYLVDRAETINGVLMGAYLTIGQILLQVKRKFNSDPNFNGWFKRWCNDTLPISYNEAIDLSVVAEKSESDPDIVELSVQVAKSNMILATRLPFKFRKEVFACIKSGESISASDLKEISKTTEVRCEAAQEAIQEIQSQIARYSTEAATATDSAARGAATRGLKKNQDRLKLAVQKLSELRRELAERDSKLSTQEVILAQLKRQISQRDVQLEQQLLDPEAKRKRAIAKTVVDANKSLDLLLSTIDRFATDKDDIGEEAIEAIERKMSRLKSRLHRMNATKT